MTNLVCPNCGALKNPKRKRCDCYESKWTRKKIKPDHIAPAPEGSLEAAHQYQLHKSISSGSWANTGYRAPFSAYRQQLRKLYSDLGPDGWHFVRLAPRSTACTLQTELFISRCEKSRDYWRNEFDGLMGSRATLWLAGCTQQQTRDYLQLSKKSLAYLDREIHKFSVMIGRCLAPKSEFFTRRRKMQAGVAERIIRQKQKGYDQSQSLPLQQVNPFSRPETTIYEGEVPEPEEIQNAIDSLETERIDEDRPEA